MNKNKTLSSLITFCYFSTYYNTTTPIHLQQHQPPTPPLPTTFYNITNLQQDLPQNLHFWFHQHYILPPSPITTTFPHHHHHHHHLLPHHQQWENTEARKALNKNNSKGLTALRQKLKKYNKNFEDRINQYREVCCCCCCCCCCWWWWGWCCVVVGVVLL